MKTVRKILLICLMWVVGVIFCATEYKVYANAYYEIDVKLGYDNRAKYGRYIPVEMEIYSEEIFEGTISVQRDIPKGGTQICTYPIEVEKYGKQTVRTWVPFFEKDSEFIFVLKNSAGEEVKRTKASVDVLDGDYTELFVGVMDEKGVAKRLFNQINLGEYSDTTFPYILTRTLTLKPEQITGQIEYTLDCLDVVIVMDEVMATLSNENIELLLTWVESGKTLIIEYTFDNINTKFLPIYRQAYNTRQEEDELRPGLWMFGTDYGEGHVDFLVSDTEERNFYAFANNNEDLIGKVLCKGCTLQTVNDIINYDMYYANYDDSYAIRYMLNTAIGKPVPNIENYITVIVVYIVLVGPVLYLLLGKKRRARYIILVIILLAGAFSYGVYRMGHSTRFTDMFLQYANIVNITEDDVLENTYICANVPYKDTYYMKVPSDYTIMPLSKMQNDTELTVANSETEEYMEFVYSADTADTKVILQNETPFSREYLEASRRHEKTEAWQVDVDITYYDGVFSGEVVNESSKDYMQTALIMYGKIMLLGELESGDRISVDDAQIVTLPYYPSDVAKRVTGLDALLENTSATGTDALYEELDGKASILEYVIDKYFDEKNTNAVLVGFTDDEEECFQFDDRYETFGFTMIYEEVDIKTSIGNQEYEPLHYTAVTSADSNSIYDAYSNTTYGSWVRLQYSFDDVESLSTIIFGQNDTMDDKDNYYGTFTGVTYFYNYNTLLYDKVDISKEYFFVSELEDYLLETVNGYTLTVQYNIRTTGQYRYTEIKLPDVAVIRRNAYVENTEP